MQYTQTGHRTFSVASHHERLDAEICCWQGYIVRSGLQYGADYVLYEAHPAHAHARYCVLVQRSSDDEAGESGSLSWNDLEIANRLATQVCGGSEP